MKARLLLIDDDNNLRETLRDVLEIEGYDITEAASGAEAMQRVVTGTFDVILCDFQLTDKTGIEVIHQIRQMNTESEILMMTAHASLDTAVKAIQESVYDFLIKPVDIPYLKRVLAKAVEKLRLEQENRRLIRELKRANEELLHFNNMKSKFMSMASHDLSNSLMTLQVSVEMLGTSMAKTEDQAKMMAYITSSIGQLSRLIEDLVDWAAIESGKFRLEPSEFNLQKSIEEMLPGPQRKAASKKIDITVQANGALPPLNADRRRLTQVVQNLLENAIRHTPPSGHITLKLSLDPDGMEHVAVQDSGDGIEPAEAAKIFESFYQGSAGAPHGRLGLGLSIAREIITSHGGRIWVESEGQGKGATFHLTLPVKAEKPVGAGLRA